MDQKVLDYEVIHHIPYFGFRGAYSEKVTVPELKFFDTWGLDASFCFSPYVMSRDKDDHILRHKTADGHTTGYGWMGRLNAFLNRGNWNFKVGFDYTYLETDGKQDQYWYGDDPATAGVDDTGSKIDNINLQIKSSQYLWWGAIVYTF